MMNIINWAGIACVLLSGCQAPSTPTDSVDVSQEPVTGEPVTTSTPDPTPSATPSVTPSPSPSPTVTVETFNATSQGNAICTAFASWNSSEVTIEAQYTGYTYNFNGTGVTVTYTSGPFAGQTDIVLDPVTIDFGGDGTVARCTVVVDHGAVQTVTENSP